MYLASPGRPTDVAVGLSLQQVRVDGECFYSVLSLSFIFLSPLSLFHHLYYIFYLSSSFLGETTQNDPQGLTCR